MNYKKLIADNQNPLTLGGRPITNSKKFQLLHYDEKLNFAIEQVYCLNEESKKSLISKLNEIIKEPQLFEKQESYLFQLIDISNRYLMIKELINKESKIDFGLFGTLLYLSLTCFDSLGQKNEFKTFQDWLNSKNNEGIKELQKRINFKEKIDLRENISNLYETRYKPEYGVKNSFVQFLNSIKGRNSYKVLVQNINLSYNVRQQLLNNPDFEEKLKLDWLYSFRNNYTHNTKNIRFPLNSEEFKLGYYVENQTLDIYVKPNELLENVLKCIKDGIELKLNQLGISLI